MDEATDNDRVVDSGQSQITLSERGQWFHQGEPFENPQIIAFFHRAIRKDEAGRYYLHNAFEGQKERVYFAVEDTAYFVRHLAAAPDGRKLLASLNTGAAVELDPHSLAEDRRGVMYCRVLDDDRARLTTAALHDLAELAAEDEGGIYLALGAERIYLHTV